MIYPAVHKDFTSIRLLNKKGMENFQAHAEITPIALYLSRRQSLKQAAILGAGLVSGNDGLN